ncbi:hypothetical protein N7532_004363 [Penicillium argentinense]|uniref:Uncharacterized protein n=1 Tax=Penicillium argentinense TaxID=1131581 RepID=A0A9W9FPC1_9EURO|nr:uncharacterized protein N7532_004363 [Penicillium argentinense]KAJ5103834.1 hypothetical protein N7532_004363 [Penicillium argentinense]
MPSFAGQRINQIPDRLDLAWPPDDRHPTANDLHRGSIPNRELGQGEVCARQGNETTDLLSATAALKPRTSGLHHDSAMVQCPNLLLAVRRGCSSLESFDSLASVVTEYRKL